MIHYREAGTGPIVLLLHGFCEDLSIWEGAFKVFSNHYRVIAVDLPGFGRSTRPETPFALTDIAASLNNWRREKKIHEAFLIGHSLGGYVALAMAKIDSSWIRGLGLFHSTALQDSEEKKLNRNKTAEFIGRHGSSAWTDNFIPALFYNSANPAIDILKEKAGKIPPTTLIGYTKAMRDREGSVDFLQTAKFPFFFIAGAHDTAIPLESVLEQQKRLPGAGILAIQSIGHMGMFEDPDSCYAFILKWLEEVGTPDGT